MQNYHVISEPTPPDDAPPGDPAPDAARCDSESESSIEAAPTVGEVNFSLDPDGIYLPPQTLVLSCETPGAVVRYAQGDDILSGTLTDFDPAQPLVLAQSTPIAAQAFVGEHAGPLRVAEYTIKMAQWQKREPADQSDPTPHEVKETAVTNTGWHLAGASTRGKLHAHRALWREDSFAWSQSGAATILVVSDGAGSAPLSRVGSASICRSVTQHLNLALADWCPGVGAQGDLQGEGLTILCGHLVAAARQALRDLERLAQERERPLHDFAATLLVLLHFPLGSGALFATLQVGDGALALYNAAGELTLMGRADHGEHSSETRFLTTRNMEADLENRVGFAIRDDVPTAVLMTDGVSDDFFPEDKRLGEVFEALLPLVADTPDAGAAVLEWLGYEKKGSSDDRTLVMMWRPEPLDWKRK